MTSAKPLCDPYRACACILSREGKIPYSNYDRCFETSIQYYDDDVDILKVAVSIPGVLMRFVLNKALIRNPKIESS